MLVAIAAAALAFAIAPQSGAIGALGRIVDRSVGMWLLRRLTGRGRGEPPSVAAESPAPEEIAYRIGVPGAPEPNRPDRLVVTGTSRASAGQVEPRRRLRRDPAALLVGASVLVLVAAVVLPQLPRGQVLDAIDDSRFPAMVTQPPGPDSSDTAAATPSASSSAASPTPSASSLADASASPASSAWSSPSVTRAPTVAPTLAPGTPRPTPVATPPPTATPRPVTPPPATPRPTPPPTTAPTPSPPPTPTPPPPVVTPSPTPPPPIAVVGCVVEGFTVSCTSAGSQNAVSYSWTFEAGPTAGGPTAQHTYAAVGDYLVTLTVTNSVGQTDSQSTIARVSG